MKTSLEHLPDQKQQELQRTIEIIREEIDLDMLILFGSYARGDWVEDLDPETPLYRYQSDFDLLVITETPRQAGKVEQNSQLAQCFSQNDPPNPNQPDCRRHPVYKPSSWVCT